MTSERNAYKNCADLLTLIFLDSLSAPVYLGQS